MNKKQRILAISAAAVVVLVIVIVALARRPSVPDTKTAAGVTDIRVAFKLDPRLNSGVYGGDHWVSPPTHLAQDAVEVRALGLDAKGNPVRIAPKWTASDPDMVTIAPAEGNEVKITVKRAGQSSVQVSVPGVSKELAIKAESQNNVLRFEITQREAKRVAEAAAPGAKAFDSEKEKRSYALGENLGLNIRRQSVEVDVALVVEGFKDGLAGSGMRLGEDDVRAVVGALEKELLTNMVAAAGEKNKKEGEAFLADNKSREGVVALESGLQYKVLKAGDGKKPTLDDTVVCKYRGTLIDGREFDTSDKRGKPGEFPLKRVIKGWAEALQLMPVGSKWQLFIPPELAYGARGNTGGIGPNATLIFEVELVSIKAPSAKNVRAAEADDGEKAAGQEH